MDNEVRQLAADLRQWALSQTDRGIVSEGIEPQTKRAAMRHAEEKRVVDPWFDLAKQARPDERLSLDSVRVELGDCKRCPLSNNRRNIVFGCGSEKADLFIIGEAPGYHEDQQGEPFVGPAGQMLDRMLENVLGLGRERVYISNIVKCRPPQNRIAQAEEIAACRPFLEAQFVAVQPKIVLVLGGVALKAIFDTSEGIMRARGQWREWGGVPMMPTLDPAYLLRNGADKRLAFQDLKAVRARYDAVGGSRD